MRGQNRGAPVLLQQPSALPKSLSTSGGAQHQSSQGRRTSLKNTAEAKAQTLQIAAQESLGHASPQAQQQGRKLPGGAPLSPQSGTSSSTRTTQGTGSSASPALFRRTGSSSLSMGTSSPSSAGAVDRQRSVPSPTSPSSGSGGSGSGAEGAGAGAAGGRGSGLLARRLNRRKSSGNASGLQIDTQAGANRRCIRRCENIAELYKLGGEVMPSVHRDMEIRWATARTGGHDQREVVVKVRYKKGSFHSPREENSWRVSTEMMLNLPPCSGIARIMEVLEDRDAYYVVMEKVGGMDLFETLHAEGKMKVDEVKQILTQLLEAVAELHEAGCIHKDLKLENVMFDRRSSLGTHPMPSPVAPPMTSTASGRSASATSSRTRRASAPVVTGLAASSVKLIDFDTVEEWCPKSPKAVDVLGTDQYIAPEAYDGRYSPASDMFAVGVIGYRLLTGSFPFRSTIFDDQPGENWVGSPKMKEIKDRLHDERVDWRHPVFASERGLQHILARMLAVKEALRPSAKEVLSDPCLSVRAPARGRFGT